MPIDVLKPSSVGARRHRYGIFEELKRVDRERCDFESVAAAIVACGDDLEATPLNR